MTTPASSENIASVSPLDAGPSQTTPNLMSVSPDQASPSQSTEEVRSNALIQYARLRKMKENLLIQIEAAKPGFAPDINKMSYPELEALEEKLKDELLMESVKRDCTEIFLKQMLIQIYASKQTLPADSGAGEDSGAAGVRARSRVGADKGEDNQELSTLTETLKSKAMQVVRNNEEIQGLKKSSDNQKRENERLLLKTRQLYSRLEDGSKEREEGYSTPRTDRVEMRLVEDLEKQQRLYTMRRKILQGLIAGSGIDWARDPPLRQLLLELGKKSPLS